MLEMYELRRYAKGMRYGFEVIEGIGHPKSGLIGENMVEINFKRAMGKGNAKGTPEQLGQEPSRQADPSRRRYHQGRRRPAPDVREAVKAARPRLIVVALGLIFLGAALSGQVTPGA
jgi:hypothetical protein